ncbi:22614_t:CDS:2 [Racocetra persica]|uniref:22614_t:CDS:1 n=1 Tax=Racocetra persica TaxID=160502 RepID=A0ACA9Q5R5_9GLOM|nr:22614_t:CDS:2 [Racocetra persica]
MQQGDRHILLLLDGTMSHATDDLKLTNTKYTIDCDEAGETKIYKVDQLTAIFYEIRLDNKVVDNLNNSIEILSPCHPMSLENFTSPQEEINLMHQEFTDIEMLEVSAPAEEDNEDNSSDDNSPPTTLSNKAKLEAIRNVINLFNKTAYNQNHNIVHRALRAL